MTSDSGGVVTAIDPRHVGPACEVCDRPQATEAAWTEIAEGGGDGLCWGSYDCDQHRVNWRAEALRLRDAEAKAREIADGFRAQLDSPLQPYVDCICPGCPRKVPQAWASGMCSPCVNEDCDHTDGARATAEERDTLLALNETQLARVNELVVELALARADLAKAVEEREALRAQLQRLGLLLAKAPETLSRVDDVGDTMETAIVSLTAEVESVAVGPAGPPGKLGFRVLSGGPDRETKELLRVGPEVTPADLRGAGFPDLAAMLESGGRIEVGPAGPRIVGVKDVTGLKGSGGS